MIYVKIILYSAVLKSKILEMSQRFCSGQLRNMTVKEGGGSVPGKSLWGGAGVP